MIGERLEEARKRKSVTIREAAEATKIRGDYLISMEDNSFDIPLPQIYIRGFLKTYARFLKMDPDKILTDYDAHLLGRNPTASSSIMSEETLGHVELKPTKEDEDLEPESHSGETVVVTEAPEEEGPDPELHFNLDREKPDAPTSPPPTLDRTSTKQDQESWNENKTLYMKIGVVFAGILLVSVILIVLIQLLTGDEKPEINPDLAASSQSTEAEPAEAEPAQPQNQTIVITASDNVTLIVEQTMDRKRLFSGSLNAGESIPLDREGPVSIRFTNGSAITIRKGDQTVSPGQAGVGRTVVQ